MTFNIPDDATIDLMLYFGLKDYCVKITAKNLGNPFTIFSTSYIVVF